MATVRRAAGTGRRTTLWFGLFLVLVLGITVTLQVGWLGELATAQGTQRRRALQVAAERMASDFQTTLAEVQEAVLDRTERDTTLPRFVAEVVALRDDEQPEFDAPAFVARATDGRRWLVRLDTAQLALELFPALARAAFGAEGLEEYCVSVVTDDEDHSHLYQSRAGPSVADHAPDLTVELHLLPNRWTVSLGDRDSKWTSTDAAVFVLAGDAQGKRIVQQSHAPWHIEVRHLAGSLEAALAQARTRNFLLGGGTLALLVAGFVFLLLAHQRARRLAERELAFIAGVSHELRTPLAVARTAASNLKRGIVASPEKVAEYGELIEREVERVSALAERVLHFSSAGSALDLQDVDVNTLIRAAIGRCRPWRDRKRFEIEVEIADNARTVRADAAALTSALHNLIENAIKYGDDDQTVRVRARCDQDFVLEVADTGPGVASRDRPRLFEPFYRGSNLPSGVPGHGLGLAVASDIARAHGGRLVLLDTPKDAAGHAGATFALHLPRGHIGAPP